MATQEHAMASTARFASYQGFIPEIGNEVYIHESSVIIGEVYLRDNVSVWPNCTIRGDEGEIVVGACTNIQDGTTIHNTGGFSTTQIGREVTVGHCCLLHGCLIEDHCLIGMGSIIMDNARIGAGSYIGAGTLLTANKIIPPRSLVYGNPAQIIREVGEKEDFWIDRSWKKYAGKAKEYLAGG